MTAQESQQLRQMELAITKLAGEVSALTQTVKLVLDGNVANCERHLQKIEVLERDVIELKSARSAFDAEVVEMRQSIVAAADKCVRWRTFVLVNGIKVSMLLAMAGWLWHATH